MTNKIKGNKQVRRQVRSQVYKIKFIKSSL